MSAYEVLIIAEELSELTNEVQEFFGAEIARDVSSARDKLISKDFRAIVIAAKTGSSENPFELCEAINAFGLSVCPPILFLTTHYSLQEKIQAFEAGCDDYIDCNDKLDEICARITKSIFHAIANEQLAQRLESATETAHSAMADNSDLGASIQFLLAVHECDNLDQLGQQFFSAIERYGLKCSLQMRTEMEVKDMEAHGMSKDLESQLLYQLKDSDRYVDFGRRTIMNFDRVSILVKNMPVEDPEKYGAIKDNTFSLVQGINARVLALEEHFKLVKEHDALRKLSDDVKDAIGTVKESYQHVMREIADGVDLCAAKIEDRLPHLALTEHDEMFVQQCMSSMVEDTTRVFNEGLRVDEVFERLEGSFKKALNNIERNSSKDLEGSKVDKRGDKPDGSSPVELF